MEGISGVSNTKPTIVLFWGGYGGSYIEIRIRNGRLMRGTAYVRFEKKNGKGHNPYHLRFKQLYLKILTVEF